MSLQIPLIWQWLKSRTISLLARWMIVRVKRFQWMVALLLSCGLLAMSLAMAEEKPFAEHRVVLQLSDNDAAKQTLVLNVANNLIKAYGVDKVDVEIVTFGPGLQLLLADNPNLQRIADLSSNGLRFAACSNTLAALTKKNGGKEPALNPHAVKVSAGVVRIIDLVGQGYTLIRP